MTMADVCESPRLRYRSKPMITAAQARMARAALRWRLGEAARRIGISKVTLGHFETEQSQPARSTNAAIRRTYEAAGVEFSNNRQPGVRLKPHP